MGRHTKICAAGGCQALCTPGRRYCGPHADAADARTKERWKALRTEQYSKTPEASKFYHSAAWERLSKAFRVENPLCSRCKAPAALVHHKTERAVLISRGESPLDPAHLESLCWRCHNRELTKRPRRPQRKKADPGGADLFRDLGLGYLVE